MRFQKTHIEGRLLCVESIKFTPFIVNVWEWTRQGGCVQHCPNLVFMLIIILNVSEKSFFYSGFRLDKDKRLCLWYLLLCGGNCCLPSSRNAIPNLRPDLKAISRCLISTPFLFDQPPHEKYHIICRFGVSDWSRTRPLIFARWMLTHGRLVFNWTDFKHYYLQMNMHAQEWSGNQAIIMPFDASSHNHFGFLVLVFEWRGANLALFRWH